MAASIHIKSIYPPPGVTSKIQETPAVSLPGRTTLHLPHLQIKVGWNIVGNLQIHLVKLQQKNPHKFHAKNASVGICDKSD